MVGEVVINDQDVPALLHEIFGHGGGGIGRHEMQSRQGLALGHHHDAVVHDPLLHEVGNQLGHRRIPLADGAINADDAGIFLINQGVQDNGGLARLPVPQDQLPLAPADGHQGVHHLQPRLQRHGHRGPGHDGGGFPLHRAALQGVDGTQIVQGTAQGVHHPSQKAFPHRHIQHPAGAPGLVPGFQINGFSQKDDADFGGVHIKGHPLQAPGEADDLLGVARRASLPPGQCRCPPTARGPPPWP